MNTNNNQSSTSFFASIFYEWIVEPSSRLTHCFWCCHASRCVRCFVVNQDIYIRRVHSDCHILAFVISSICTKVDNLLLNLFQQNFYCSQFAHAVFSRFRLGFRHRLDFTNMQFEPSSPLQTPCIRTFHSPSPFSTQCYPSRIFKL